MTMGERTSAGESLIRAELLRKTFCIPSERSTSIRELIAHPFRRAETRELVALSDVSFDIRRGEWVGIIGNNGSGKTTLLRVLAGIYEPDRGRIRTARRISPLLELGTGFNPDLSARDNVLINGCILGIPLRELRHLSGEILATAGVAAFAEMKVKNFSSGMTSRLAFAIASQVDADAYLLDEVLAVGDHEFQKTCFDRLEELKRKGKTIVLVTHNLDAVREHCTRCLLLDHGRLIFDGSPEECIGRYLNGNSPPAEIGGKTLPDDPGAPPQMA